MRPCATSCAVRDLDVCTFCASLASLEFVPNLAVTPITSQIYGCLFTNEDDLLAALAYHCKLNEVIVEIGSFHGRSTVALAFGSRAGANIPIYTFDDYSGGEAMEAVDAFDSLLQNLKNHKVDNLVIPAKLNSTEAARNFSLKVGLLFIDGNHSYESCKADVVAWQDKVTSGGRIAFHDCMDPIRGSIRFIGPLQVIFEQFKDNNQYTIEGRCASIVVVRKA